MFSKSANPLDLQQKSTIRAPFVAKSVDLKTYSPYSCSLAGENICLSFRLQQIIDALAIEKSRCFSQPSPITVYYCETEICIPFGKKYRFGAARLIFFSISIMNAFFNMYSSDNLSSVGGYHLKRVVILIGSWVATFRFLCIKWKNSRFAHLSPIIGMRSWLDSSLVI